MPILLLVLLSLAVGLGVGMAFLVVRWVRRNRLRARPLRRETNASRFYFQSRRIPYLRRPACWLAVKSRNLFLVQSALGLHNPKPCSWTEGLAGEEKLFIAPPVRGWILVIGSGLPDPGEDVDSCFRFVVDLSRKLGQVQFFSASRVLHHHAWVKAEAGRVLRAYAWAGKTLWNQGLPTAAERELNLRCFDYADATDRPIFGQPDLMAANTEKVPLLAARWSLDPARIDERFLDQERGIAGEPSRRY